ncbi:MAG: hypothetical protein LBC39_06915 [Methanobrevibacter sp.]|jgi:tetratricopeptide (TPR) repeat protein|nr:hypothetical protein [Candidatus Methanovirga aequatorialis]
MSKITKEHLIRRAKKFFKKEKYENCIKTSNKILKMDPDYLEAYMLKLRSLQLIDRKVSVDDYEKTVLEYLNHSPKDEKDYLMAIDYLSSFGIFDSTSIADEGIKMHPDSYDLLLSSLKTLFYDYEKFDEDMEYVDSLSKTSKFWKKILYFKANIYREEEQYAEALEIYNEILNHSRDLETLSRKLRVLKTLAKDDEALEILDKMIEEDDEKNWALVNKELYFQVEDEPPSTELIDEVIKNNPEYGFAYYGKASVLSDMEKYDAAKEYLDKALKYDEILNNNGDFKFLSAYLAYNGCDDRNTAKNLLREVDITDYSYYDSADLDTTMILHDMFLKEENDPNGIQFLELDGNMDFDETDFFKDPNYVVSHTIFYKNHDSQMVDMRIYNNPMNSNQSEITDILGYIEGIELYDDTPEKKDLKTVEDYEHAISEFYDLKGDEYFKEHEGVFWKLHETRPFMMWLLDYSALLWEQNIDKYKSIDLLEYLLVLNPDDNQGARDVLMTRLLELNRIKEFEKYSLEYDDFGAFTLYNNALFAIKNKENDRKIKSLLKKAVEFNEHIIPYLTNKKPIPKNLPEMYSYGDLNEADYYATIAIKAWNEDEIAMKKMNEYIQSLKRDFS